MGPNFLKIQEVNKKERLQYIDALRGVAMLMVVFAHVEIYSFFGFQTETTLTKIISMIHMPLFFFISGFCVYKRERRCRLAKIKGDFLRLIIPALIVGLIYTDFRVNSFLADNMKAGYWFTISLFEMLLIYYILSNVMRNDRKLFIISIWVLAIIFYVVRIPLRWSDIATQIIDYLSLFQTFSYFLFFCLGITVAKYKNEVNSIIINESFRAVILSIIIVLLFIFCNIIPVYSVDTFLWRTLTTLVGTLIGLFSTLMMYILFKSVIQFNNQNILHKSLIVLGNNTLAIYLLHYFVLPSLPMFGKFLNNNPSVVIELFLGLSVTVMVIVFSFAIKKIIMLSPFLGKVVLGDK